MPWIESHAGLSRHPKTLRLMGLLGTGGKETVGLLHLLWHWAIEYVPSGKLAGFSPTEIAAVCDWDKDPQFLVDALVEVRYLERRGKGLRIHDWNCYAGRWQRILEANRLRQQRWRETHPITRTSPVTEPVTEALHNAGKNVSHAMTGPDRTIQTITDQTVTDRRARSLSAVDLAQESQRAERQEAVSRLVDRASKRFRWRLTKTSLLAEHRFAGELLDLYPEGAIAAAIDRRQKLSSIRWLAEWMSVNQAEATPSPRPAILDAPPGVSMPEEIREQIAQLAARKAMP